MREPEISEHVLGHVSTIRSVCSKLGIESSGIIPRFVVGCGKYGEYSHHALILDGRISYEILCELYDAVALLCTVRDDGGAPEWVERALKHIGAAVKILEGNR